MTIKNNKTNTIKFILASASPRRRTLLTEAGYSFKVIPSSIDESLYCTKGITPKQHTKTLALAKAENIAKQFPDTIVMGSDTVVDLNGQIIGKPDNADHAEQIIRKLFKKPHKVITALALVCINKKIELIQTDTTIIYPKDLTDRQISDYIKTCQWKSKAGAYGIQDKADEFIDHIEGSFTNAMGLPMTLVNDMLAELSIHP